MEIGERGNRVYRLLFTKTYNRRNYANCVGLLYQIYIGPPEFFTNKNYK